MSPPPQPPSPPPFPPPSGPPPTGPPPSLPDVLTACAPVLYTYIDNCVVIAGFAILVYDYFCTLEKEVTYAWSCPRSLGLILFYMNRYLPFIDQSLVLYIKFAAIPPKKCVILYGVATALIAVGLLSAQIIITLRTCGMWARRRWVMVTLGVLTLISLLFGICITFYQIKFVNVEMTPLGYSLILSRVPTLCAFIFSFLSESVIVILTIIRAYQYFQQSRSPWVVQIYKSGIIYCIFIICLSSINILLMAVSTLGAYGSIFNLPTRVFHSIFGNRIMLLILRYRHQRMQDTHERDSTSNVFLTSFEEGTDWGVSQHSDIELVECAEGRGEESIT